jgi:hypothetical protein
LNDLYAEDRFKNNLLRHCSEKKRIDVPGEIVMVIRRVVIGSFARFAVVVVRMMRVCDRRELLQIRFEPWRMLLFGHKNP